MIGIYKFTNKYNRKCYIGQSTNIERRYIIHKCLAKKQHKNTDYFHNALNKYGIESFDFQVLIECPKENLNYWEKFYIRYYSSNNKECGYNLTDGGYSTNFSNEIIQKMSDAHKGQISHMKGKHPSEETRRKQSESAKKRGYCRTGYIPSEETKKKISDAKKGKPSPNKGKHFSDEYKKKLSEAHKGQIPFNLGKKKIYKEDGTFIWVDKNTN